MGGHRLYVGSGPPASVHRGQVSVGCLCPCLSWAQCPHSADSAPALHCCPAAVGGQGCLPAGWNGGGVLTPLGSTQQGGGCPGVWSAGRWASRQWRRGGRHPGARLAGRWAPAVYRRAVLGFLRSWLRLSFSTPFSFQSTAAVSPLLSPCLSGAERGLPCCSSWALGGARSRVHMQPTVLQPDAALIHFPEENRPGCLPAGGPLSVEVSQASRRAGAPRGPDALPGWFCTWSRAVMSLYRYPAAEL